VTGHVSPALPIMIGSGYVTEELRADAQLAGGREG
jgi:hypothetical protein